MNKICLEFKLNKTNKYVGIISHKQKFVSDPIF